MSVIRQDPTTKEWVILASERAKRPDQFAQTHTWSNLPAYEAGCPFCPGNESFTPPELLRIPGHQTASWRVRVVPNKFAALSGTGPVTRREAGPIFREMEGIGSHEVIIESPRHNQRLAQMADEDVEQILLACRARYRTWEQHPYIKSIIIFKNHGPHAGTSLEHPHMQLVATPVAPLLIRRKYEVAISHYDDTGRCLYRDVVEAERAAGVRMIAETHRFIVFVPFAARLPFETWIVPQRQEPSFGQVQDKDLKELASVLRRTLAALDVVLHSPDFNYVIHSAPTADANQDYFLWHIQILPRITTIAGFELGSGIFINTALPEDSAIMLRASWQSC
ncbi:MAG: galactose-1-phosphate uridylyltransferase [Nitrospirae bacterium]|nr:MAG: galactose-1-phosphate uridylyltransferase [Nitrospirota bacterium]